MKEIFVICEGHAERDFCDNVLKENFERHNKKIIPQLPELSNGGIVPWVNLKDDIEINLQQNSECFVTTFIDYYGILEKHNYPEWVRAKSEVDKIISVEILENGMLKDIEVEHRNRFIPYVQLHEYEALLFHSVEPMERVFTRKNVFKRAILEEILQSYPNPEDINDGDSTHPKKRMEQVYQPFRKTDKGAKLAQAIGLPNIRSKCPHFNNWITQLENL